MTKIQDLYQSQVKVMQPSERLQLARLILDDLVPDNDTVDVSEQWSDDDLTDLTAFSVQHAGRSTPGSADEKR